MLACRRGRRLDGPCGIFLKETAISGEIGPLTADFAGDFYSIHVCAARAAEGVGHYDQNRLFSQPQLFISELKDQDPGNR